MEEELKEKLFNKKKVGWENLETRRKEKIFNFCKDYMDFLNKAKTEREFVKEAKKIADLMNNPLYFNKKQATSSRLPVLNIILYSAYQLLTEAM